MEYLQQNTSKKAVRAVLFDFDGTISTLRCGWEEVMGPLMLEMISGKKEGTPALRAEVSAYISESTGIQTIHQMKWLANRAKQENKNAPDDPWWYKAEYNRRLMLQIGSRIESLKNGVSAENFLMRGSREFLSALREKGVEIYIASGTDHPDVVREAEALGLSTYFTEIAGAPLGSENCSKEKVIAQLIEKEGLAGEDFAVIGDGKVEIRLGREAGARTVGLASNEEKRFGINPVKRERLIAAGADLITGDFSEKEALFAFLGL